jgi:1A family penicillin-binding protein
MPIPHLAKKSRSDKPWQTPAKKAFLNKKRDDWRSGNRPSSKKIFHLNVRTWKILAGLFLAVILGGAGFVLYLSRDLPNPNKLMEREVAQSTKILDRTGQTVLYDVHGDEKRTLVALNDIPASVKNATVAIEDKDFYKHGGFSLWAMFRTAITNVLRHQKAGGSTLTQQFIKNAVFTNEKLYTRKIKELILAYRLEKKFSKDEILQMYLNEIPYGSTAYGVEAASQKYFGKDVKDVNLAEATILAALPQAPSRYSPYGPNKDLLIGRQQYILDKMVAQGYISQDEADAAKKTELAFQKPTEQMLAPHFVMYVKELLGEKYGDKNIEQGGYKIYTTLDLYKQKIAEEVITEKAAKNEEKYQATNAALVSIDPKTGQILAMVGSKDYFDDKIDGQVNVATSPRQPGSSFKPIVYTAAFIKGYTPNTVLYDVVTNFSADPAKKYEPHNYDSKEHGPVTIRQALAGSLNIPAVKAIYLTGLDNVLKLARELGYTTLNDKDRFGLSLVLGGGEVELLEHTNAYSALAREGMIHPISAILKIEDKDGKVIEEYKENETKVFDAQIARETTGILSDNSARAYVFGENNYLTLGSRPVAAKTGTTNDYKDAWTIGYTPSLVTGVWVGNSDATAMKRGADGSVVAAPIWNEYMKKVLGDTPVEYFKAPDPVVTGKPVLDGDASGKVTVKIDRASGLLATDQTPASFIEEKTFISDPHSILRYVNKDDPRGPAPTDPAADPQYAAWEAAIAAWAKKQGITASSTSSLPPTETDNVHKDENLPVFTIDSPVNNQTIDSQLLSANISPSAPRGVNRAEYYLNGNLFSTNYNFPFGLNKDIGFLKNGYNDLLVRVCDDVDNCAEKKISFNFQASDNISAGPLSFAWLEPANGQSATAIDFPLMLKLEASDPRHTAKIIFYYRGTSASSTPEASIIGAIAPVESQTVLLTWKNPPPSGTYSYWAEGLDWTGQAKQTEERTITIQ